MKNQVIKNLTPEMGEKIIKYWQSRGVDTRLHKGIGCESESHTGIYYGVIDGRFNNYSLKQVISANAEIIELPEEKTYPRVMMVWDYNESEAGKRVVEFEKEGYYHAWKFAESFEEIDYTRGLTSWKHAKEIEEPQIVELTMEDISNGKGVGIDPKLIRIKK